MTIRSRYQALITRLDDSLYFLSSIVNVSCGGNKSTFRNLESGGGDDSKLHKLGKKTDRLVEGEAWTF